MNVDQGLGQRTGLRRVWTTRNSRSLAKHGLLGCMHMMHAHRMYQILRKRKKTHIFDRSRQTIYLFTANTLFTHS